MIELKRVYWGIDTQCESCCHERMGGYELIISICEMCVLEDANLKQLMKSIKAAIREERKKILEENAKIKEEFIDEIIEAEKRVEQGKCKTYNIFEFIKKFKP